MADEDAVEREGAALQLALSQATGSDKALDQHIHAFFFPEAGTDPRSSIPDYTGSVEAVQGLIKEKLKGWRWHIGFDASGILPYTRLSQPDNARLIAATAPTVPLALLRAVVTAFRSGPAAR